MADHQADGVSGTVSDLGFRFRIRLIGLGADWTRQKCKLCEKPLVELIPWKEHHDHKLDDRLQVRSELQPVYGSMMLTSFSV